MLHKLKQHIRDSFGIQLDRLPDNYSMFFGASPSGKGYVVIPVIFMPGADPTEFYEGVIYEINKQTVKIHDHSGDERGGEVQCILNFDELLHITETIWSEIEGKSPKPLGDLR